MKEPDFGEGGASAAAGFCSERQGLRKTKERTNKEQRGETDYRAFLDSEYCRNTFDIFPDLLDGSRAGLGTQFPKCVCLD